MTPEELLTTDESKFHINADVVNYDERVKVLNHYDTFAIFDRWGDVHPHGKKAQGIFHKGMRYINRLELRLNGKKPILLSSAIKEKNDILSVDLTNSDLTACDLPENSVHIARSQVLRNSAYYEELSFVHYGDKACDFEISLAFSGDFRDIFEIRGLNRAVQPRRPDILSGKNKIIFDYLGLDKIRRRAEVVFREEDSELYSIQNNTVRYKVTLKPQERFRLEYFILFLTEEHFLIEEEEKVERLSFSEVLHRIEAESLGFKALFAGVTTSNEKFNHWINRSQSDLLSLLTQTPAGKYPYAGVPWYNTAFGRDGIITAMEVLWLAPEIARDALMFLARMQATELIPEKDAEPGKIMHEVRTGEMANTGEIPFKEYYGTIDATPLFVMLAGMYYRQTADLATIKKIWPHIKAALQWIDRYGDLDGDGFVEYQHKAANGLTNQGWKDSYDSIMYADGGLCEPPIALCEVQGYTYSARRHASFLAAAMGEEELSDRLMEGALLLKRKFNEQFWDEELGSYVLALDRYKKKGGVLSSNAGHCLMTGIVEKDRAGRLVQALTSPEMFSGWGVRTLSAREKRYNPMSYHNGSIWPHDNALIAYGMSLYGYQKEGLRILQALFDASLYIDLQRLPELYCGFERRPGEGPTAYPVACSPQAWSVGAVFLLLQACLRMDINALEKKLVFDRPVLPEYLEKVTLTGLRLGNSSCTMEIFRHQYDVGFHLHQKPDDWEIIIKK
jgi:glycogen debranching enzyme